ncbi:stage II sporulation protein D [Bacillota bacterium]
MRTKIHKRRIRLPKNMLRMLKYFVIHTCFVGFVLLAIPVILLRACENGESISLQSSNGTTVSVYRQDAGVVTELDLETYVAGVVAGEMPSSFEPEALKAQAVAARTYGISKVSRGSVKGNPPDHLNAPLCDTTHCQVYRSEEELLALKGGGWMEEGWLRIQQAVKATEGEIMYYEGTIVEQPLFHSSSGGKTENSEDVFVSALPYLRSVESPYEGEAPYLNESISISMAAFKKKIGEKYGGKNIQSGNIRILSRSEGGCVKEIQTGDIVLSGRDIRELFGLRSADFSLSFDGNESIVFTTHGYGHGVGMSQWGANGMAKAGYDYKEILKHYYVGVTIM